MSGAVALRARRPTVSSWRNVHDLEQAGARSQQGGRLAPLMRQPRQDIADQAGSRQSQKPSPNYPLDYGPFHGAETFHGADAQHHKEILTCRPGVPGYE